MILYTFAPEDWDKFYLVPFQLLRKAFQENYNAWKTVYPPRCQQNRTYWSKAMFVPASVVIDAVSKAMQGRFARQ